LKIGASQTIGQYLLPQLLASFLKTHPQLSTTGMSGNSDEVLNALAEYRIDLALIEGPSLRSDVTEVPFMEDHMVLVVPPNHEWADREISPERLRQTSLVTREVGSGSRRIVESALESIGVRPKDLTITMTLDSTEGLLSAVEAGLGIAFVSRWAVRNQLTLGTLKVARIKGLKLARVFSVAYRTGPLPQGSTGAFRAFLLNRPEKATPRKTGKPAGISKNKVLPPSE
jgi:DNA-binding transcriptional LysR family regulator